MDVLKDKNYKDFDYTCRYSGIPYYYHSEDEKYFFGTTFNLDKSTSYVIHEVTARDTLDSLALRYYDNPTLYWVIAYFNDIQDAFINLGDYYKTIKIPTITGIKFGDMR